MNPLFERIARERGFYSEELARTVSSRRSIQDLPGIPDDVKAIFLTAADVTPEQHVRMQARFQKHCDASVSKTINLPESASRHDVRQAYELAYQLGCKGVTIYRDNSRPNQVLSVNAGTRATFAPDKQSAGDSDMPCLEVRRRPDVLEGVTEKIRTGYGNLYVTVNVADGRPFEVFAHIGKSGYTTMADTEAICRMISLALRSGVPVEKIIRQLRGIGGSSQVFSGGSRVSSIPDRYRPGP